VECDSLAGEKVKSIISKAPGNNEPIGGVKVSTEHGWFVARPSGAEDSIGFMLKRFADPTHSDKS